MPLKLTIYYFQDQFSNETLESTEDGLDSITETENEEQEQGDDEMSEGITGPVTDDTATEDETLDHTQGSDEDGKLKRFTYRAMFI